MSACSESSSSVPRPPARASRPVNVAMQHLPPPPPPPPQGPSSSVQRPSARTPRHVNVAMQHLPPPPPPPAVPSTSNSQLYNPVYCGQAPQPSTSFAITHPPTPVVMFDARRPPPPIHNHVHLNNNTLTRPMSNSCTAPPCKLRKTDEPNPDDTLCDVCVQRELSIENYRQKMEKMSSEDELQSLLFKKKMNKYQRQKDLLQSLVDSNMYRKIEEFVEDVPQYNFHSVLNNLNDSFLTEHSSPIPNQILLQFMNYFLSDSSKFESSQSVRAEDSLRQTISAMSRSPVRRSSPDLLQTLQDMLYNEDRSSSSERSGYGELTVEEAHSPGSSGVSNFRRYSNGQRAPHASVPASALPPVAPAPSAPLPVHHPSVPYPQYPPPRAYYPPSYVPAHRPTTSRAAIPPRPSQSERYPPPFYYYQ